MVDPVLPAAIAAITSTPVNEAAAWSGLLSFIHAASFCVAGPLIARLSDRWGRRPLLAFSLLSSSANLAALAFASSVEWLVLGRLIAGGANVQVLASIYIADRVGANRRHYAFSLLGAALYAGQTVGPVLGGLLATSSIFATTFAATAVALTNAAVAFLFLAEAPDRKVASHRSWFSANLLNDLIAVRADRGLSVLLLIYFLFVFSTYVNPSVWGFFAITRFGWNSQQLGLSIAYAGCLLVVVQVAIAPIAARYLGSIGTLCVGFAGGSLGLIMLSMAQSITDAYIAIAIHALSFIAAPTLRALAANLSSMPQSTVHSALGGITAIAMMLAPVTMTQTFRHFSSPVGGVVSTGAPYVLAGVLLIVAALLVALLPRSAKVEGLHPTLSGRTGTTRRDDSSH